MPRPPARLDWDAARLEKADVTIVGAGPAGLAAAREAAGAGMRVLLIDENADVGGQIWRGEAHRAPSTGAVRVLTHTSVLAADGRVLLAQRGDLPLRIAFEKLVLCTGARERWIPFPGWTLPHVMGAGGMQAMVKNGLATGGKRVVVAGSGPLLLAVAAYLKRRGAVVAAIVEQADAARIRRFAMQLLGRPAKLAQAAALRASLVGVPYLPGAWIVEAQPGAVTILDRGRKSRIECDYVAAGYGLVPNTELAQVLGCGVENGAVAVDELQRTSVEGVWCAGEPVGIGGVDAAEIEGRIAGLAASGKLEPARALTPSRARTRRFAGLLAETFALREELIRVPTAETTVCRCENVTLGRLRGHGGWREAKLQSRCGMGPCQGRVCGPIVETLFGWRAASIRPPVLPASVGALAASTNTEADRAE
ncbi:MAG: FAD/NAD(P)-binding oxidoreductase [Bryobacteraceae bacterium]